MDGIFVVGLIIGALIASLFFSILALNVSRDPLIIQQCQEKGYWQMSQTRIKCTVENK